jgi:hypothetical protein
MLSTIFAAFSILDGVAASERGLLGQMQLQPAGTG